MAPESQAKLTSKDYLYSFKELYKKKENEVHILHTDSLLSNLPTLSNEHLELLNRPFS